MSFYVYILQSDQDGTYYKGSSQDPGARLRQHNEGRSRYTAGRRPWRLVYVEELETKREMLIRERKLKRGNAHYFQQLIAGDRNIVERFVG